MGKHSKPDDEILAALDFEPYIPMCETGEFSACRRHNDRDHPADHMVEFSCGCLLALCEYGKHVWESFQGDETLRCWVCREPCKVELISKII